MSEDIIIENDYEAGEKQSLVHTSTSKYKVLKGGLGSGKTRTAVEEINTLLAEYPGIVGYVMRKTMPSLRDSTLHEFKKYLDPNFAPYNGKHEQFNCVNQSQLRCRGLDEPWKIKGSEVAFICLDEADEFTRDDFITLKGRLRQKNRDPNGKPYPLYIILVFNPVDESHWLYKEFVLNADAYQKDGGLLLLELSTYDNIKNLPAGYIEQTCVGMSPDEIERLIFGKWGALVKGEPIYGKLITEPHIKKWDYKPGMIVCRGWDFGYNRPACVWRLKDSMGRKNIHFELLGEKEEIDVFARRVLSITEQRYGKVPNIFDYCDPRGFDKKDTGQSSVEVLNDLGIFPIGERNVREYVEPGIKMVRKELSTLIEGQPELTISPECAIIRAAYCGKYVRNEDGDPRKDKFYEHICDADRYISWNDRSSSAVKEAILNRATKTAYRTYNRFTGYGR
jgi:hypothetical protein